MYLIVGLGNPGKQYQKTRHNVGFMAVDKIADKVNGAFGLKTKFKAEILKTKISNQDVILAKPQTFMNESGKSVKSLITYYSITPASAEATAGGQLLVIHDDIDLPLGQLKIQKGGGTAGHHGLESIVKSLGTADFVRLRVGISRPLQGQSAKPALSADRCKVQSSGKVSDYVLEGFSKKDWLTVEKIRERAAEAIEYYLEFGIEKVMNKFNSRG